MRFAVLVVPGLVAAGEGDSVLRQSLPALERLATRGQIFRLEPPLPAIAPEAAVLGIDPARVQVTPGPLWAAAFGYEPPARSAQFVLSLLSVSDDGVARKPRQLPEPDEVEEILRAAERLQTRRARIAPGEGLDHVLAVEDGSIEIGLVPAEIMEGRPIRLSLPDGEGETLLRRLIDDSVNLLNGLEFNRRRAEEGEDPLNLLWPWGVGFRTPVPNLPLETGLTASVHSGSRRLSGLARMVGWRHGDVGAVGAGAQVRFEWMVEESRRTAAIVLSLNPFAGLAASGQWEDSSWLARELDRRLLAAWANDVIAGELQVAIVAPSQDPQGLGLALVASPHFIRESAYPFDERTLADSGAPLSMDWRVVARTLFGI